MISRLEKIMDKLLLKRAINAHRNIKTVRIKTQQDAKDSFTAIRKHFIYHAEPVDPDRAADAVVYPPEIRICKSFDTKKRVEKFKFHVKGEFYMTYRRKVVKVEFRHFLHIHIRWKNKKISPKKSEVLT